MALIYRNVKCRYHVLSVEHLPHLQRTAIYMMTTVFVVSVVEHIVAAIALYLAGQARFSLQKNREDNMKSNIRTHRWDWFDKVQMWRGRAPQQRQAIGQAEHTRYYFGVRRFVHCITADTICQMEYVPVQRHTDACRCGYELYHAT